MFHRISKFRLALVCFKKNRRVQVHQANCRQDLDRPHNSFESQTLAQSITTPSKRNSSHSSWTRWPI
ncbi:hypothetical protein Ciccas_012117 [Cichlidogyrus casuarinus]|uniref:Uncharacterized protein n=1 Tax=Cichlidogyrus casuarinus TaxID=1844966 RepID=A0ABD2PQ22_9PLAT